ncbi:MAG: sulfate adenylyltransferase, partial [Candidatus Omnitrophica bacterium]|nr:sulfate adenylyltransferase [Candidatus Omnitrophota bacterium]
RDARLISIGEEIGLCESDRRPIALMKVSDKFTYPKDAFCKGVFKTDDKAHPGAKIIMEGPDTFLGGEITLLNRPRRSEVESSYYLDPRQTREEFRRRGWSSIVAFQTRNPIHRAHEYLIKCALESVDGVLIHPLVGETKPDDIPAKVRMKCYEALIKGYFNKDRIVVSVLPTFMRYAGPREAINHAIIRKNYGCTHFIIGRDHAGVGNYYGPYEAQELLVSLADRLGITPLRFENSFFCKKCGNMASAKTCPHDPKTDHLQLSGTKVREMLKGGIYPPEEFSRKEVVDVLIDWAKSGKRV